MAIRTVRYRTIHISPVLGLLKKQRCPLFCCCCIFFWSLVVMPAPSNAVELTSSYASIIYKDTGTLKDVNDELYTGRLNYYMPDHDGTEEGEIRAKIDMLTHRVQVVLDMFPENLKYNIYILKNKNEVKELYYSLYRKKKDYVAFYSPKMNTVYISPDKLNLNVLAHEIGHVIVENYFQIRPPEKVHEVLAQFAEKNLGN